MCHTIRKVCLDQPAHDGKGLPLTAQNCWLPLPELGKEGPLPAPSVSASDMKLNYDDVVLAEAVYVCRDGRTYVK